MCAGGRTMIASKGNDEDDPEIVFPDDECAI